jgi:stage II sporulation protein P
MKRRRRNNSGNNLYMFMSVCCLVILFAGYTFVYEASEERKTGKDITTISIDYEDEENSADESTGVFEKIMSYFNIFLEETFKENNDGKNIIDNEENEAKTVFKTIGNTGENSEENLELYSGGESENLSLTNKQVYLANNRREDFFKVIESSTASRSSVPREISIDAASVNEKVNIVLYHTHGTEAFQPYSDSNYRTKDEAYNIMGIGNRLAADIKNYGLNITHLSDYNDYPDYNKSYANSNSAVKQVLSNSKKNILIDLHRDGADENSSYEDFLSRVKTAEINGKAAATCTLVIGEKNGNLEEIKKTAIAVYETANELYPGLFREIVYREGAYFNQYLSDYSMLIEIGSTLNNVEEIQYSADLLSEILCKSIEKISK